MKLTAQQMQQLENCSSAEEIMTLAKRANITITLEQAQKAFDLLKSEEVPDDWMVQVTGGGIKPGKYCGEIYYD